MNSVTGATKPFHHAFYDANIFTNSTWNTGVKIMYD